VESAADNIFGSLSTSLTGAASVRRASSKGLPDVWSQMDMQGITRYRRLLTADAGLMPDGNGGKLCRWCCRENQQEAIGFRHCTKLFSLEKKSIDAEVKARKDYRQNVIWPLLEEYFAWLKAIHAEKGSKLEDAVRYSLNQKQQLVAFLDYGDVPISNNLAENAIRPFVVGRKNWLFCGQC